MPPDQIFELDETIRSLCGSLTGVRIEALDSKTDMTKLAARFAHLPGTVLLLSGGDSDCARYSILGALPWLTLRAGLRQVHLSVNDQSHPLQADLFAVLQACLRVFALPGGPWPEPLAAGLMGFLAYDLKDALETLPRTSVDELGLPAMIFYAPSLLVVQDKREQTTRLMIPERGGGPRQTEQARRRFREISDRPAVDAGLWITGSGPPAANFSRSEYEHAVQRVIDYIAAGDVYQVNLSQRFETPFQGSGFAFFRHLFQANPAPFFAYIQAGDFQIVSTSPERFLLRRGSRVESRPIKGTRPRRPDPDQDEAMRRELAASAKDDAELSMIVDLMRNDIGRVSRPGSVRVAEHKRAEAYENVYHLVSIVEGELEADKDSVDLVKAAFPGGSITGCPKLRAMEIIDELEPCRRHAYCGSIGYISFHDTMDLSIAIRTATIAGGRLCYSVGGGIVFDSDPEDEYEETLHKGRTLMGACRKPPRPVPAPMAWLNGRLKPASSASVPAGDLGLQYGFGFFETIRVDDGRAPLLSFHEARFAAAWKALMPGAPPDLTWEAVIEQVLSANHLRKGCAAVKILATRGRRSTPPWDHNLLVMARAYESRFAKTGEPGLALAAYPHPRQTPLAAFKTLNYLYYHQAGLWARRHGFDEALVLNPDGSVSETNSAGLLLINGRRVIRPLSPASLPGVMADAVCRRLGEWGYSITHAPVQPGDLLEADQVLAANALMGAVPVIAVDNRKRPAGDHLWHRLNDTIIPGWR